MPPVDDIEPPHPDSPGMLSSSGHARSLQHLCDLSSTQDNMKRWCGSSQELTNNMSQNRPTPCTAWHIFVDGILLFPFHDTLLVMTAKVQQQTSRVCSIIWWLKREQKFWNLKWYQCLKTVQFVLVSEASVLTLGCPGLCQYSVESSGWWQSSDIRVRTTHSSVGFEHWRSICWGESC